MTTNGKNTSSGSEKKLPLVAILNYTGKLVYYGAAFALLVTVGMLFFSVGTSILAVFETGPLDTALTVLGRVLLIFIFVEWFPGY